jgi:nifR3 family TIM-barrel protein
MAGITDKAFRVLCKEQGCGLVYTEMVSSKGLFYGSKKTEIMLDIDEFEAPVGIQLFGSDPEIMGSMAELLSQNPRVALIDINMGCPAPKIIKNCEGSALMKDPVLAEKIIKSVVRKSVKPVTVKFRKGWDDTQINAVEFGKMAEEAGAAAVTVHGRTRAQMYEGFADWSIIAQVKKSLSIPVVGNGDVVSPESARKLFEETGCDGIMVARGAMGNPWLFKRINIYLESGEIVSEPSNEEKIDMAIRHLNMMVNLKGSKGVIEMRKHIAWYLKGMKGATRIKENVNKIITSKEMIDQLLEYKAALAESGEATKSLTML